MSVEFVRLDVLIVDTGTVPDHAARVLVSWEVAPAPDLDQVVFAVERSLSPSFAPDEVDTVEAALPGAAGERVYSVSDHTPSLINEWRRYFYRVRATRGADVSLSEFRSWEKAPRVYELAIIERHDYLLRYETGAPAFAFIERTIGAPNCGECYDRTAGRTTKSQCLRCVGTGRERPFFTPIPMWIDFNPGSHLTQIAALGEVQTKQRTCWFSAFPVLKPGDVLYQVGSGDLWRIARIGPNAEPQGVTILQVAALDGLGRDEVEYKALPQQIPDDELVRLMTDWEAIRQERRF